MKENAILINNLTKIYRVQERSKESLGFVKDMFKPKYIEIEALRSVSLSIKKGEVVGIIGKNGSGKSTLIKHLCGILKPNSGDINVLGMEPFYNRQELCKNIGIIFGQRLQLFWNLPARDTFEVLKSMYKIPDETFNEMKEIAEHYLNLNDIPNVLTRELSLGQKNRFNFACSILHNPKILILDEPTIGLDILARTQTRNLLRVLNEKYNTTILLVTHDASDVDQLCERIVIIDKGIKTFDGSTAKFKELWHNQRQVLIMIEDSNVIKNLLYEIDKIKKMEWSITRQNQFTVRIIFPIKDKSYITEKVNEILGNIVEYEMKFEELNIENILAQMFEAK